MLLALVLIVSCGADAPGGDRKRPPPAVRVITVEPAEFQQTLALTGTIEPTVAVALSSPAEGPVQTLAVREGDRVGSGQLLVTIGRDRSAEAALAAARETLETAQREFERMRSLVDRKLVSVEQLDAARTAREQARSALSYAEQDAEDFRISAPWDGIVASLYVAEGRYVGPREPLLELYDPTSLVLRFYVPERYAFSVAREQALAVRFDAFAERDFALKIVRAWPELDRRLRTRTFEAALPAEAQLTFLPGQFARISLPLERVPSALVIPATALLETADGSARVLVLNDDSTVAQREVVAGGEEQGSLHIREGLAPGDRVVVEGLENLEPGQQVRLAGPPPA
jgi:membrane fusion protein, multidrug efflux system